MKILYEGVDIYPDISVHRCYHDMYAEKQSDELLLKLNDTRELWDSWNPKKGDTIAIEDGAAKTGKMFVESVVPESGIITLRAYSIPQSAKDKRSKSWEKVKFLQLAQEIAGRHSLTLETYGITDQTYDYVEQNNLADFRIFQNRCTLEGAAFLVYDGKLVVYDEAYMESQQPVDTITITPANDFEYRDEGTNAYGSAEAVNGGLTGTFAAPNGGDKVLRRILPFRMTDQSEADRFAKGLLRDANKNATVGTLWTGSLLRDYAAGSVVTLATEGVSRGTAQPSSADPARLRQDAEQAIPPQATGGILMNSNNQMIQKGKISSVEGKADRNGDKTTARVLPSTADSMVTRPLTIPWYLRGEMGNLTPGTEVAYAMFEDGTGIILSRMDGEWDGIVPGDITVKKGALTMQDKGISVPSADVTATGISLTGHTHTDSIGGSTSGPQ